MIKTGVLLLILSPIFTVAAGSLVDPTLPTPLSMNYGSAVNQNGLQLNATYISNTHRYAIINGVKLRVGEFFGDMRLQRINHKSVDMAAGDRNITLQLNNLTVKTQ